MSKFTGILKIAGLTFLLGCGTIFTGIGLPLLFAGQHKADVAVDTFLNSDEYKIVREYEDQRLEKVEENIAQLETKFESGELSSVEYQYIKKGYEDDIANSKENFESESFDKLASDELKGMLKSGNLMNYFGCAFTVGGGLFYSLKLVGFVLGSIVSREVCEPIGEFCVDIIKDVAEDEFGLDYYEMEKRRQKKQQKLDKKREKNEAKKKEKESRQDDPFMEDEEEVLGNIEDTYYREDVE